MGDISNNGIYLYLIKTEIVVNIINFKRKN